VTEFIDERKPSLRVDELLAAKPAGHRRGRVSPKRGK
jgi:hypothetical protein